MQELDNLAAILLLCGILSTLLAWIAEQKEQSSRGDRLSLRFKVAKNLLLGAAVLSAAYLPFLLLGAALTYLGVTLMDYLGLAARALLLITCASISFLIWTRRQLFIRQGPTTEQSLVMRDPVILFAAACLVLFVGILVVYLARTVTGAVLFVPHVFSLIPAFLLALGALTYAQAIALPVELSDALCYVKREAIFRHIADNRGSPRDSIVGYLADPSKSDYIREFVVKAASQAGISRWPWPLVLEEMRTLLEPFFLTADDVRQLLRELERASRVVAIDSFYFTSAQVANLLLALRQEGVSTDETRLKTDVARFCASRALTSVLDEAQSEPLVREDLLRFIKEAREGWICATRLELKLRVGAEAAERWTTDGVAAVLDSAGAEEGRRQFLQEVNLSELLRDSRIYYAPPRLVKHLDHDGRIVRRSTRRIKDLLRRREAIYWVDHTS